MGTQVDVNQVHYYVKILSGDRAVLSCDKVMDRFKHEWLDGNLHFDPTVYIAELNATEAEEQIAAGVRHEVYCDGVWVVQEAQ